MITFTALWLSGLLALAVYVVLFPVLGALISADDKPISSSQSVPATRFLILVPAHNEGGHLRTTIHSLRKLEYPPHLFDIAVIADNCIDDTASIAHEEGCQSWERSDLSNRGKGYALGWALARPSIESYGAVVIIDADTLCSRNLLQAFDRELAVHAVPVQARVQFEFPPDSPAWLALASSATQNAEELYVSRPRSWLRLYQGLQGTGFCLPVSILRQVPWSAYSVCEDLEYAFQLAAKKVAVRFLQDAYVSSWMTGRVEHASQQRQRWARGTYRLIAKLIPVQLARSIANGDWRSLESCFYLVTRTRLPLAIMTLLSGLGLVLLGRQATPSLWIRFAFAMMLESIYVFAIVSVLRPRHSRVELLVGLFRYSIWVLRRHFGAMVSLNNTRWNRTERG